MPHIIVFEEIATYWFVSPDGQSNYSLGLCETDEALVQASRKSSISMGLEKIGMAGQPLGTDHQKLKTYCDANRISHRTEGQTKVRR
jgi:hypothetical protein